MSDPVLSPDELAELKKPPRTYATAWQWEEDGTTPLQVSAEEWLRQEADVHKAVEDDGVLDPECPESSVVMRAIAEEIEGLRNAIPKLLAEREVLLKEVQDRTDRLFWKIQSAAEREGEYANELQQIRGMADPNVECYGTISGGIIVRLVDEDSPLVKIEPSDFKHIRAIAYALNHFAATHEHKWLPSHD